MSLPDSAAVLTVSVFSPSARHTVALTTSLLATARSTSRNCVTGLSSIASRMSPGCSTRAASEPPTSRATLSTSRADGLACSMRCTQASLRPKRRALGQRLRRELRLQRMQRPALAHDIERLGHQVARHAAILLHQLAAVVRGEARPQAAHPAAVVGQHADEVIGRVHQRGDLQIALAKLHRARQRQLQRIDVGNAGDARLEFAVAIQSDHVDGLAGLQRRGVELARPCTGVLPMSFGS